MALNGIMYNDISHNGHNGHNGHNDHIASGMITSAHTPGDKHFVVAAIDFGTTNCSVAYTVVGETGSTSAASQQQHLYTEFPQRSCLPVTAR